VWHEKDLSLLKGPERRTQAYIFQPCTCNDDGSIQVKKILEQDVKP
jgi:hypothetical protein